MNEIESYQKMVKILDLENQIHLNDLQIMNQMLKDILNCRIINMNGESYMKAADIVKIYQEGMKILSTFQSKK